MSEMSNVKSPERLYLTEPFDLSKENVVKHIARYNFASQFVYGNILDCACGSGYGSKMLAEIGEVIGVDASQEAIDFARYYNKSESVNYIQSDIEKFSTNMKFDSIVCIETFEHLTKGVSTDMLLDFDYMLKPSGILFLTTPMLRYKDGLPYVTNPHHINEMPRQEIMVMINMILPNYTFHYFHQEIGRFTPLEGENTGFLIVVGRKK